MIERVPEAARALGEIASKSSEPIRFKNQDIRDSINEGGLNPNDLAMIRRVIPFASEAPIVPVHLGTKKNGESRGALAYQSLNEEEFENYTFTDNNFNTLNSEDIGNIVERIYEDQPDVSKKDVLRYLTVCDMIIQLHGRGHYIKQKRSLLACSIMVSKEELDGIITYLVRLGILSIANRMIRYNTIFKDASDEDAEAPKAEGGRRPTAGGLHDFTEFMEKTSYMLEEQDRIYQALKAEQNMLHDQITDLKQRLANEKAKNDGYEAVLESYGELQKAYNDVSKKYATCDKNLLKINLYKKNVYEGVRTVLMRFSKKASEYAQQYESDHKADEFNARMTILTADTLKSAMNAFSKKQKI